MDIDAGTDACTVINTGTVLGTCWTTVVAWLSIKRHNTKTETEKKQKKERKTEANKLKLKVKRKQTKKAKVIQK